MLRLVMEARRRENFRMGPPGWSDDSDSDDEDITDEQLPADLLEAFFADDTPPHVPTRKQDPPQKRQRFAAPATREDVARATKAAIPIKTQKDTNWCVSIWNQWCDERSSNSTSDGFPVKLESDSSTLASAVSVFPQWLPLFTLEARKQNGDPYPPETLYHIICGIFRFVRLNGSPQVDFFHDKEFAECRSVLDSEMKRLKSQGVGSKKRKAEPLTVEDEEVLWEKGILGDHSPQALLNAVFFQNGVNFALRSGSEHRALRHDNCQITVVEVPGQRAYLQYVEDISKNNPGGLKGRKITPKKVIQYANLDNTSRCPVRLFKLYNSLCPKQPLPAGFYLQPLKKVKPDCWYSNKVLGHNKLDHMVQDMCTQAEIPGHKTNHSLQATTATRLYHAGIDEQLIMERTGHHSIDGVRSYKRTNEEQLATLSDILNVPSKRISIASQSTQQQHDDHRAACFDLKGCTNCTINIHYGSM